MANESELILAIRYLQRNQKEAEKAISNLQRIAGAQNEVAESSVKTGQAVSGLGGIFSKVFAPIRKLFDVTGQGINRLGGQMQNLSGVMQQGSGAVAGLGGNLATMGTVALGGAVAVAKVAGVVNDLTMEITDYAVALNESAMRAGTTVENMRDLEYIARKSNMSLNDATKTVEVFDLKMSSLQTAGTKTRMALDRLGISVKDQNGEWRDTFDVYTDVMKKMEQMNNADRSEVATDIFGRLGAERAIKQAENFTEKMEDAQKAVGDFDVEPFLAFKDFLQDLSYWWDELKRQLAVVFMPLVETVWEAISAYGEWATQSLTLIAIFEVLYTAFEIIIYGVLWFIDIIVGLVSILDAVFQFFADLIFNNMSLGEAWGNLWDSLVKAFKMLFGRALFWLWDKFSEFMLGLQMLTTELFRWAETGVNFLSNAFVSIVQGVLGVVEAIINGIIGGIEWTINQALKLINPLIRGYNKMADALGLTAVNELSVDFSGAKKWISDRTDQRKQGVEDAFGDLGTKLVEWSQGMEDFWAQENPFADWLPQGKQVDEDPEDPIDPTESYERGEYEEPKVGGAGRGMGNLAKNLGKVNDELEKQVQLYQVIYGKIFRTRAFFDQFRGSPATYGSYSYAGVDYDTTFRPVNVENMVVRNESDITKIAVQLNNLSKRDSRRQGVSYGY